MMLEQELPFWKRETVLVKILSFEGRHKLSNKWEDGVYKVLEHPNTDIPVYIVQKEDSSGPKRKLHRNHLLPVNFLPLKEPQTTPELTKPPIKPRVLSKPPVKPNAEHIASDDSDSDTDEVVVSSVPEPEPETNEGINMDAFEGVETDSATSEVFSDLSDNSNSTNESTSPIPAPRRSKRDSKCPIRYGHGLSYQHTDGNAHFAQPSHVNGDWAERASFLADMLNSELFKSKTDEITQAILQIVKAG